MYMYYIYVCNFDALYHFFLMFSTHTHSHNSKDPEVIYSHNVHDVFMPLDHAHHTGNFMPSEFMWRIAFNTIRDTHFGKDADEKMGGYCGNDDESESVIVADHLHGNKTRMIDGRRQLAKLIFDVNKNAERVAFCNHNLLAMIARFFFYF